MTSDTGEQFAMDQLTAPNHELQKKLIISYTRDFLISLRELDVCKKLPSGFDQSLLSEFDDTSQDRQRISGALSSHNFRRNEYGSSPPTRGELGNYSRTSHGRWDTSSSGRSDKDSDSQFDMDSDSGRRYGQTRRSWQVLEHDGLLGSGSFPRPSVYAAGTSVSKPRSNEPYQLNRSNEPYHPPRPYKAVPHLRKDTDAINDETFGSSESTTEDRTEEERKRRASFELMRKEQQKARQENQKSNPEKRKDDFDLLGDSKDDKGLLNRDKVSDENVILPTTSEKSCPPSLTSASRPLVPPGFTCPVLERNSGTKALSHPDSLEVGNPELEVSLLDVKDNNKNEKIELDSGLHKTPDLSKAFETSENNEAVELDAELMGDKIAGISNQDHPTSLLDKLFGNALTLNGGSTSGFIVHHDDSKPDDSWSPHTVQSSKFAHWFLEEDKKPVDDLSSGRPNNLLSLIVGGEKMGSQLSDVKALKHIPSSFPFQSSELVDSHRTSNATPDAVENSDQFCNSNIIKPGTIPAVLTCEDLEQTILSEMSEKVPTLPQPVQGWGIPDERTEQKKSGIIDHASQHLLSLLQKRPGQKDIALPPNLESRSSDKLPNIEAASGGTAAVHNSRGANAENLPNSGKHLALETLFGTAFMKELQSVGAPVSAQRGSLGFARVDGSESGGFPSVIDDGLLPSTLQIEPNRTSYESSVRTSNQRERITPDVIEEHLIGFDDPQPELGSSRLRTEVGYKHGGFDGSSEIRLPEEESLITVSDPFSLQNFMPVRNSAKADLLTSSETAVDIAEKLAALNAFRDERSIVGGQEGPHFVRAAYDMREPNVPFHNRQVQSPSPQLHPPQLNHVGPLFNTLDSHPSNINTQMKFIAPEGIIHHDPPPNQPFSGNMHRPPFHHPGTGLAGFDPPNHPILQQMQMRGNFPPHHLLRAFSRGAPLPHHSNNQGAGLIPEVNSMQGYAFGQRQPNFAGLGISPPAPEVVSGSNHPDVLQRLIEMELRSNSKQIHPLSAAGRSRGMHGHELDMGFGYR
ncbi:hypothetical protein CFOL_v3_26857 [Cephalotus follicularis]|uniref:Uncharacterized protein n=1 Tax=Cephalotus follicularis TaxID=3775 RepID=A0A1Q3CT60_CEPFO|nr:hypothetical protein CFOL_v3_26857 [Cephalotus follicularis]